MGWGEWAMGYFVEEGMAQDKNVKGEDTIAEEIKKVYTERFNARRSEGGTVGRLRRRTVERLSTLVGGNETLTYTEAR